MNVKNEITSTSQRPLFTLQTRWPQNDFSFSFLFMMMAGNLRNDFGWNYNTIQNCDSCCLKLKAIYDHFYVILDELRQKLGPGTENAA